MQMERGLGSERPLQFYPNLFLKQTKKGCCQECCGCEANTEFKIATKENKKANVFYALENTSCCLRFCCPSNRPFHITVSEGDKKGGAVVASYHRAWACPVSCCKCCCRQRVEVKNSEGHSLGNVKEQFWMCFPKFDTHKPDGSREYSLHPPTCCCGMCIKCCSGGCCKCCVVPFDVVDVNSKERVGRIAKVWSGMTKEAFTDADNFETDFPVSADAASKARILGAVFLLNQVFFESVSKTKT